MININLDKAKEIWKDKIREKRKPALEQLDIEVMRANENEEDTTSLITEKQVLRDLPNDVDNADTTENIKNVWHERLGNK